MTLGKVKAYDRYRTREAAQKTKARKALSFARKQLGKPYSWGAAGPARYDCSGLAMAAWRRAGVRIPRVTYSQYSGVRRKVALKNLRPGDLIFFHGRSHVGIYIGHGRFLHAPNSRSRVRIDKLGAARRRQFAGAVRPGAPAYKKWSPSIRELVEKIDRMSVQEKPKKAPEPTVEAPLGLTPGLILRTTPTTPAPPANEAASTPHQWPTPPDYDAPSIHHTPFTNTAPPANNAAQAEDAANADDSAPTNDGKPEENAAPANETAPANGPAQAEGPTHANGAAPTEAPAQAEGAAHANSAASAQDPTQAEGAAHASGAASAEEPVQAEGSAHAGGAAPGNGSAQAEEATHSEDPAPVNGGEQAEGAAHSDDPEAIAEAAAAAADEANHANEQAIEQEMAALDGAVGGRQVRRERRPVPPRGVSSPVHGVKAPVGTHEGHGRPANLAAVQPRPAALAKGERPLAHKASRS
ncbi:C40 family peptidase [Actinomadura terrae]|uniref:C40 family peptidase n=1 Tax=Actinomadura terrae TaxID=604353 RepID=UPI001FA6EADC|nr:C40 family peptidase [Actinomadura terrae]